MQNSLCIRDISSNLNSVGIEKRKSQIMFMVTLVHWGQKEVLFVLLLQFFSKLTYCCSDVYGITILCEFRKTVWKFDCCHKKHLTLKYLQITHFGQHINL